MKTAEVARFGLENLQIVDRPEPRPGPGQVLVRLRAMSLNYRDLLVVEGKYNPRMRLPVVPLSDGAGEVAEVGEGVSRLRPGDRVAGIFMQRWIDGEVDDAKAASALGGAIDGVAAEYVVFDHEGLVPLPDYMTFSEAATLPCAAVTAWNALVSHGRLRPDETLLTQGTGGVSIFAVQIARLMRARVMSTSSSDEKLARVRELGAEETVNYRSTPEWHKAALAWTGGRGVDHVVEVGGAATMPLSIKAVRMGGRVTLIGVLTGSDAVPFTPIFMRTLTVQGIYVGSREMFEDLLRAFATHQVRPVIDRVFGFSELRDALGYMAAGSHFGKIVIEV